MKKIYKGRPWAGENDGTFLFDNIVNEPVISRRLGLSLGVNLLPKNRKLCSFNCIYCECGNINLFRSLYNKPVVDSLHYVSKDTPLDYELAYFPSAQEVERSLLNCKKANFQIDSITFAGNGEPTLHPQFLEIVELVVALRNKYCPKVRIAVLSNSTRITHPDVFKALSIVDDAILKMDSAIQSTIEKIYNPQETYNLNDVVSQLVKMEGKFVLQTMFLKAEINNKIVDNTTEEEISEWLKLVKKVKPRLVQIYSVSRIPALQRVDKIGEEILNSIAQKVNEAGIETLVTP